MVNEPIDSHETEVINYEESTLLTVSKERIQKIHSMAYIYYQNQRYREADALFRMLVNLEPQNSKYWKGLAACLQMKKNYLAALNCYKRVHELNDQSDVYLDIHIADCYFAVKQITNGLKTLDSIKQKAVKNRDKKILQYVAFMRERWKAQVS